MVDKLNEKINELHKLRNDIECMLYDVRVGNNDRIENLVYDILELDVIEVDIYNNNVDENNYHPTIYIFLNSCNHKIMENIVDICKKYSTTTYFDLSCGILLDGKFFDYLNFDSKFTIPYVKVLINEVNR